MFTVVVDLMASVIFNLSFHSSVFVLIALFNYCVPSWGSVFMQFAFSRVFGNTVIFWDLVAVFVCVVRTPHSGRRVLFDPRVFSVGNLSGECGPSVNTWARDTFCVPRDPEGSAYKFDIIQRLIKWISTISFGVYLYCGCLNWFCNVWVCVGVGFVMCGCV